MQQPWITLRTYIYFSKGKCVHCQAGGGIIGEEYEHDDPNWQPTPNWPYEVIDLRKEVFRPMVDDEEIGNPEETEGDKSETQELPKAEAKSAPATDELKVVIVMKGDSILMGAQAPNCDPVYKTTKGTLAAAVKQVTGLVKEAKGKWSATPKYPKANLPEPPPRPVTTTTRAPKKSKQASFL